MKKYILYGVLLSIPIYTWFKLYREWKNLRDEYEKHQLFTKRHNCTVMYRNGNVIGWPCANTLKHSILADKYEPILYFIRTSEVSLDIAVMVLNAQCVIDELVKAMKRNVKIRIIADYEYNYNSVIKQLLNSGISLLFYVCPQGNSSIFHFKYVVKDYGSESGYLYVGSLNWTVTGVLQNYENITFISNHKVVEQFHNNFEESWRNINETNNTNLTVKARIKSGLVHF